MRFPPLYFLPTGSSLFTSHSISRYLLLFIFMSSLYLLYRNKQKIQIERRLLILILFYFLTQSLSIVNAINIIDFLSVYKNIIFGIIVFIVSASIVNKKNIQKLIYIMLITVSINIIFEYLIYFHPNFVFTYLSHFFYSTYLDYFYYQFQRQRFFLEMYEEVFIPFLFYHIVTSNKRINKIATSFLIAVISFFTFVSNWRFKAVMLVFAVTVSVLLYFMRLKNYLIPLGLGMIVFLFLGYFISLKLVGFNTLDRLLFSKEEDVNTIVSRFSLWNESLTIGLSSPIFGGGLGNFYDYLHEGEKLEQRGYLFNRSNKLTMIDNPHNSFFNVLASSGLLGLLSFILLILYFVKSDVQSMKRKVNYVLPAFIIAFWTLFFKSIFSPESDFTYQFIFWFLRGIIYKLQII